MTKRERLALATYYAHRLVKDGLGPAAATTKAGDTYGLSANQRFLLRRELRRETVTA